MSIYSEFPGQAITKYLAPADTNAAAIYSHEGNRSVARLVELNICADGTGGSATVWHNDGTTDRLLLNAKAMAANTQAEFTLGQPILNHGHSLKVMTSAANRLAFSATFVIQNVGAVR